MSIAKRDALAAQLRQIDEQEKRRRLEKARAALCWCGGCNPSGRKCQ